MSQKVLSLAKEMISIRSNPGDRKELHRALALVQQELYGFTIEPFECNGCRSILVYNRPRRTRRFKLLLNGHLDVIPGKDFQYRPRVVGDRLIGVGSMDMKANVAAMIEAFKATAGRVEYPLGLQIVTDEEIGGFEGTKYQVDRGVRADFVIAGESTGFDIVREAKGILWIKVRCRGKTAHGAYPGRGRNAITMMNRALDGVLREFPIPPAGAWKTSVNISRIETPNESFNKVPDECTAWLDVRFLPAERERVLKRLRRALPRSFSIEIVADEPPLMVARSDPYLGLLKGVTERVLKRRIKFYGAQGSSDARHFTRVGCPGVEFGPVGKGIGTDEEWVSIKSLGRFERILKEFILEVSRV